jgi:phosphate transport system protein
VTYLEESLVRDIARLTGKLATMAGLAEQSLRRALSALTHRNCQTAYSVILRDQRIDELEKEIDRLCLEFFVRQQPVSKTLRFAYAVMRINAELERVGDYAESMARQTLVLCSLEAELPTERFLEIANHAISMLHSAVESFVKEDPALAKRTMEEEEIVDRLRHQLGAELVRMPGAGTLPIEALSPLLNIVNRFERVADQAKNICQQVLYLCTGQYLKHPGSEVTRVLFVDQDNSCRSQLAEVAANSLGQPRFVFWSAGIERRPIDPGTADYLSRHGIDISGRASKLVEQVPNFDHFQIIVALDPAAHRAFPPPPTKVVCIDWSLPDPSRVDGSPEEIEAAYEQAYQYLLGHVQDLVQAIVTDQTQEEGETP